MLSSLIPLFLFTVWLSGSIRNAEVYGGVPTVTNDSQCQARQPLGQLLQCVAILAALPVCLPTSLTHPELLVQVFDMLWHITHIWWQLLS